MMMSRKGTTAASTVLKRVFSLSRSGASCSSYQQQHHHRRQQQQQRMMASTLVISEPLDEDGITPVATQSAVTAATKLNNGNDINLLVVGGTSPRKVPLGLSKVYYVPNNDKLSETVASAVAETVDNDCNVVVGTSSKFGSSVVPRAAALLDVSPITDILEIEDESKNDRCCWYA